MTKKKIDLRQSHQIGGMKTQSKFMRRNIASNAFLIHVMAVAVIVIGIGVIVALQAN